MATKTRMTLDEFLELPETEPASEFANGEVIERMAPNWCHSQVSLRLLLRLARYLEQSGEGVLANELRFRDTSRGRAYIPDVSILRPAGVPQGNDAHRGPTTPPAMTIEVLSPGESASYVIEKVDFYLSIGVELVWLVDPEAETLTAYRGDGSWARHQSSETIGAQPVLQDFTLDLGELFAGLHGDEAE